MTDILLIQPPIRDFYLTQKRTLPYGLACIAAALRQAGFSVDILDALATAKSRIVPWPSGWDYLTSFYGRVDRSPFGLFHHFRHFGYSLDHISRQAQASGAFLIGISSLFTAYSAAALETAAAIKKVCPETPIVFGGHHPTALPKAVLDHPAADFVIRGDGEAALPALALAIRDGSSLDNIPGLSRRRKAGGPSVQPPTLVADLDSLPMPATDLVNWKHYQRAGRMSYALAATRGCPLHCTYCAVNAASFHGFRQRSVESVMAELEAASRHQEIGFIDFEDEHLCARKSWILELMRRMADHFGASGPELRAMNGLYAPALDEQILAAMHRAGFRTLNLALISTCKDQLRRYGRPDITDDVHRVIAQARHLDLNVVVYIIAAGPGQEPDRTVDDLLFLAGRLTLAGVSIFYPAPGSADFEWCRGNGLLPTGHGLMRSTVLPLNDRTDRTQAVTLMRLGRILNFMKHIRDSGASLPMPAKAPARIDPVTARQTAGSQLLAAFLKDGQIYGLDEDGQVYRHKIDNRLTLRFLRGLRKVTLRGAAVR